MAEVTIDQQYHGTVNLAILQLRRLAKSNDIDAGFAAARDLGMLDAEREEFMRSCFEFDEALKSGAVPADAVSPEKLAALRACILSINSADPA